ncbi:endonuclease domain-containing protein [Streptomyces millisiae]|uniref:Endonuclease domain-containing protein n=1 Tax=Streptomyces millisiae TaxID=3075542 RepID=A0ABU2LV25_9ACTN|nr:endonuclease domain-containing protein [Streptomyces sp. DSM 44918]MDT0321445.1 endonuclease domain-containing protein [Streptomyces sp. DSM 44918]
MTTGTTGEPVPAGSLEDLPEHRREVMLWRWAWLYDYDDLDEHVRLDSRRPACRVPDFLSRGDWSDALAVGGNDGRYHLRLDRTLLCGDAGPFTDYHLDDDPEGVPHHRWVHWWTDGTRYRLTAPRDGDRKGHQNTEVRWTVRLEDEEVAPASVAPQERCPVNAHMGRWPRYLGSKSKLGRIRAQLVDAFGPLCAGCGNALGLEVDHHHFSGLVRGLLCRYCNNNIDWCPHLAGCPWADYLNNPPAAPLRILHPGRWRDRRDDQRKIDHFGHNPYDG